MKTLKKLLILALALIMSLSVFVGCGDDSGDDNGETPAEHTHTYDTAWSSDDTHHWHACTGDGCDAKNDKVAHTWGADDKCEVCAKAKPADPDAGTGDDGDDDEPAGVVAVANAYVFDYQVLNGSKMYFTLDGALSGGVKYGADADNATTAASITEGTNEVAIHIGTGLISKPAWVFKYSTATSSYTSNVTLNPITENYYNVDADTANAGYTIATTAEATNVKFKDVASTDATLSGKITINATGITFAKDLFTSSMGHNKVEYTVGTTSYLVSVCAITNLQAWSPITFEDGEMSPFITVIGSAGYEVVNVTTDADVPENIKTKYAQYGYTPFLSSTRANGTKVPNTYALEISQNATVNDVKSQVRMFISTYFVKTRLAKMATLVSNYNHVSSWGGIGAAGANDFMAGTRYLQIRLIGTSGNYTGTYINGVKEEQTNQGEILVPNNSGDQLLLQGTSRVMLEKAGYDKLVDSATGNITCHSFAIMFESTAAARTVYVDDVLGCAASSVQNFRDGNLANFDAPAA